MDFSLGEELEALRDLAREIFDDRATPDRLRAVETSETRTDEELWRTLAASGLLAAPLPEAAGGAGLGLPALCVLLEEQGRRVAPVPLWPVVLGALTLAAHGGCPPLSSLADGSTRVTLALEEFGPADPRDPRTTTARPDEDGWRLDGSKAVVPSPAGAGHVLVSAATDAGPGLFLLAADAPGVTWTPAETTTHDLSAHLDLAGARARAVGTPGDGVVERLVDQASVALAALQLGVAQGALAHAATYLAAREQFGRPLATFQAVRHQLADCLIDIEAMRVTLWQAVTALADGEGAEQAVLVAKWWAGDGGANVVHRVQHVHGGLGVDTDYPVHRHFLWGRQLSTTLGGPGAGLARLGDLLAAQEVPA
ncbi:acyl-CoA dehydrogenase family protein [Streptomyces xanthii]|uniref:Acyl-CoA/acyl-ACP dehydrogenase n=1 Tax=Streptomyces xanthii TaxID=2768069 RepID=A0A7H1B2Q0_9ACTN|nr:acyl-CoA dehydrogenase family protein [Streptomyces xanthii]QNS03005.1 acyl-CoA/acyl-ACP dehydrogenase [Streptomyces xanthii]